MRQRSRARTVSRQMHAAAPGRERRGAMLRANAPTRRTDAGAERARRRRCSLASRPPVAMPCCLPPPRAPRLRAAAAARLRPRAPSRPQTCRSMRTPTTSPAAGPRTPAPLPWPPGKSFPRGPAIQRKRSLRAVSRCRQGKGSGAAGVQYSVVSLSYLGTAFPREPGHSHQQAGAPGHHTSHENGDYSSWTPSNRGVQRQGP